MPFQCVPVLPGDTFEGSTSALVRVTPLNTPVMHPVSVRLHSFFVPNRVVMPEWEDFITGGEDGASTEAIPTIQTTADKKTVLTYLGLPPIAGVDVSELPVRAFNACFNEYFRDQDLVTARAEDDITIPKIAWEKDAFTTARPWTQKGPEVTLPLGDRAPIGWTTGEAGNAAKGVNLGNSNNIGNVLSQGVGNPVTLGAVNTAGTPNLYALLEDATAASVNDVRAAFSLQRYEEARARYGARFTEYLRYLGITPSDARLQRPEYLGGGTTRLNFSEVLQTTPTTTAGDSDATGVGDMFGHGIAGMRSGRWRKFFEEHGYIITMMSVRPKALYLNGIHRDWLKSTKEDFFQKELANLGQQEVYEAELYADADLDVFGYQDRYYEYRSHPSQITQDFRDTLNAWHMGRDLAVDPVLNSSFVECEPADRIFQVDTATADSLWVMANNHLVARRLVPKRANPRIL